MDQSSQVAIDSSERNSIILFDHPGSVVNLGLYGERFHQYLLMETSTLMPGRFSIVLLVRIVGSSGWKKEP